MTLLAGGTPMEIIGSARYQDSSKNPPMLSLVVPLYNEQPTVGVLLSRLLSLPLRGLQVVVVDDGSTDGSAALVRAVVARDERVLLLRHIRNKGKGAASELHSLTCVGTSWLSKMPIRSTIRWISCAC